VLLSFRDEVPILFFVAVAGSWGPCFTVISSLSGHGVAEGGKMQHALVQPGDPESSRTDGKKKGFV